MGQRAYLHETPDPLDRVERIALQRDWQAERGGDDEVVLSVPAESGALSLSFVWRADLESLHAACLYANRVPLGRREEMGRLINLVNEQLIYGHFDLWKQDGSVMFRNNLILAGGAELSEAQCEMLMDTAIEACERYHSAFQFAIWAGEPAEKAIATSLFDAVGRA
jgi:hypothetical protein